MYGGIEAITPGCHASPRPLGILGAWFVIGAVWLVPRLHRGLPHDASWWWGGFARLNDRQLLLFRAVVLIIGLALLGFALWGASSDACT